MQKLFNKETAETEISELLKEIKTDDNILGAYLFGSYLTGNTKDESDVDICLIAKNNNYDIYKYNLFNIVQISDFWRLPPNMQYHILFESKSLHTNQSCEAKLRDIKLRIIDDYDFYKRNFFNKLKFVRKYAGYNKGKNSSTN